MLLASILPSYSPYQSDTPPLQYETHLGHIPYIEILEEFATNRVAAIRKYEGKFISITGDVTAIGFNTAGEPYVSIGFLAFHFNGTDQNTPLTLSVGKPCSLTGRVAGMAGNNLVAVGPESSDNGSPAPSVVHGVDGVGKREEITGSVNWGCGGVIEVTPRRGERGDGIGKPLGGVGIMLRHAFDYG